MAKLLLKNLPEDIQGYINEKDNLPDLALIEDGHWIDDGKYSSKTNIWSYKGRLYSHSLSKSGSYFTEYEYDNDDYLEEVEPIQKTITVYEPVEN